jgi:cell division protein FtsB
MFYKKKSRFFQKFFNKQILLSILGLIVIAVIAVSLGKNISKKYKINSEISNLAKEIVDIEKKNLEIERLIEYFNSDQFLEEKARLSLGMKKNGEEAVLIKGINNEGLIEVNDDQKILSAEKTVLSNPQKWFFNFIKKK